MNEHSIKQFLIKTLEKYGPLPSENLDNFNFLDAGHLDSLSSMKFIISLESEFDISFSDDDLLSDEFTSIGTLSTLIKRLL